MNKSAVRIWTGLPRFLLSDLRQLVRTPGLLFFATVPVLMWSGLKIMVPLINTLTLSYANLDLMEYASYAYSFLILVPGMLGGMMVALMLVDDRDIGIIRYYGVLPFGKSGYLAGRTVNMYLLSWLLTVLYMALPGFYSFNGLQMLLVPPLASMGGPFIAFIGAGIARNKVSVMAILKSLSGLYFIPILQFFIPDAFDIALGIFPPYWVTRVYFLTAEPLTHGTELMLSVSACIVTHAVYLALSLKFFARREN